MHDALCVRRGQRVEHAQQQLHRLARRPLRAHAALRGERRTVDELEHQVGLAVGDVGLEHRHHVGVRQAAHRTCLVQPLAQFGGVGSRVEQLERDLALEARVVRQPDRGLGTAAELAHELEAAQAPPASRSRDGAHDACLAGRRPCAAAAGASSSGAGSVGSGCAIGTPPPCSAACSSRSVKPSARP